jgi:hypothetical protein
MNRLRYRLLLALLVLSSLSLHAITITSVTPDTGLAAGGTEVTIKGTGFATCPICSPPLPPEVFFGFTNASSRLIDETTIVATAPAHATGTVGISVVQWDGAATLQRAFTFTQGFPDAAFERILLPILSEPVRGGFGSEFHTSLTVANKGLNATDEASVYGLEPFCILSACIPWNFANSLDVVPGRGILPTDIVLSGKPGRFIYVPKTDMHEIAMNLRVHDVSRATLNFGTEMPIVRDDDFVTDRITLVGVPTAPGFRNTLRIYGLGPSLVKVTVDGRPPVDVFVREGEVDVFDPAYALFTDFPIGAGSVNVTIDAQVDTGPLTPPLQFPIWAFITVTNNETQLITTITPQP